MPTTKPFPIAPSEIRIRWMRKVGWVGRDVDLCNTCQHRGRVFHFFPANERLLVAEIALGEEFQPVSARAGVELPIACSCCRCCRCCCSLGGRILVMGSVGGDVFAALVEVDEGGLSKETVHATALTVTGDRQWTTWPYLRRLSEDQALLSCYWEEQVWRCDIAGGTLAVQKLRDNAIANTLLHIFSVRLPNGTLLVVDRYSRRPGTTLVTCKDDTGFEEMEKIPGGLEECFISSVLVADRFVVGFGGDGRQRFGDLWLFDLRTRRFSIVWQRGEWAPPAFWPVLVLQGGTLYIIGRQVHAIALRALSELIDDDEVRDAFCDTLGFPRAARYTPPPLELAHPARVSRLPFFLSWDSRSTVLYRGRVLHFSSTNGNLLVSELVLHGKYRAIIPVQTGAEWRGDVHCCPLGDRILVMGSIREVLSAALVAVDEGLLSEETVHVVDYTTAVGIKWSHCPQLYQVSEHRALLNFDGERMWSCDVEGDRLTVRELEAESPTARSFDCLPIRLSDGRLLGAESNRESGVIVEVACDGEARFEKIGNVPEMPLSESPLILVGERFVLGFGRCEGNLPEDVWVFDVQARRSSIVWEARRWIDKVGKAFLFLRDGMLWILGGRVNALPLRLVSERIADDEIRRAFCRALKLPLAGRHSPRPPEAPDPSGMSTLDGSVHATSCNTVQYRGRILHFSLSEGELVISEVSLYGRRVRALAPHAVTRMAGEELGCCLFGKRILVMSGRGAEDDMYLGWGDLIGMGGGSTGGAVISAVLIGVDDGMLRKERVHVTRLTVEGGQRWGKQPLLCQAAQNRALLCFAGDGGTWYCDVAGTRLTMRGLLARMPTWYESSTLPIRLPDGKVLIGRLQGEYGSIIRITCDEEPRFERIGSIPQESMQRSSITLVGERFVVGFGKWAWEPTQGVLWVFDLVTRRFSLVRKEGAWARATSCAFLAVRGNALYLIGGEYSSEASCISLSTLARLIRRGRVRVPFSRYLRVSVRPPGRFTRRTLSVYTATSL